MELLSPQILDTLLNSSVSVVLALVVIFWYRKDSQNNLADEKQRATQEREDKLQLLEVLKENTRAITENTATNRQTQEMVSKLLDKV